ncbi:ABC transporter permease [Micromonospora sp. CB01531]|uniref:ABC transporter permease n=1 Tax=unclassified Micromonospora TaxID=2617518 RepID=UPI00093AD6D8|nr:ABC transporter permease [Micromonospora sp. CB01531]OKI63430.1 peptide ABC transporter permease [Micromonospora sp. CB01531]
MLSYVARRLLIAVPTLFGVATVSFLLMRIIPGDPARVMAGPQATAEDVERLRQQLGLGGSIWSQYVEYITRLMQGDLMVSARTGTPVIDEIAARAQATVTLAVLAIVVAVVVGCTLGVLAALRRDSVVDLILSGVSVFGVSMPVYWVGLLLIMLFSVQLGWLPAGGSDSWASVVLPTVALSFFAVGFISRQTRSAMVETMELDFIRSVRAKGISRSALVIRHGLRNAALPIMTVVGLQFGQLLGGAVLTETIFAWPGLGRLLIDSISARDFATVQGTVFVFAAALILVNLLTDILYAYADPRIRYD